MVSCENLADDNNVAAQQQYKTAAASSAKPHHHVARKTGSIFLNPFKNGNYYCVPVCGQIHFVIMVTN